MGSNRSNQLRRGVPVRVNEKALFGHVYHDECSEIILEQIILNSKLVRHHFELTLQAHVLLQHVHTLESCQLFAVNHHPQKVVLLKVVYPLYVDK
jgi:hypothetical protein